jgi:parallel beta-helix repeat protein
MLVNATNTTMTNTTLQDIIELQDQAQYHQDVIAQEKYQQATEDQYLHLKNLTRTSSYVPFDISFGNLLQSRQLKNIHPYINNYENGGLTEKRASKPRPLPTGVTLYVGGSGPNNYTQIQDAINRANDGDTIFIYNDSSPYTENIDIDKSITLLGEERNSTIIRGVTSNNVINVNADFVNIRNLTIENGVGIQGPIFLCSGIYITSNHNVIADNYFKKNDVGIWLYKADDNDILHNYITLNVVGIYARDSSANSVNNNEIKKNDDRGIAFHNSTNNSFSYNTIREHLVGIEFGYSSSYNTITDNNIEYADQMGIVFYSKCSNNFIQNNTIMHHESVGIYFLDSCNDNDISTNFIQYCYVGIRTEDSCDYYIIHQNYIRFCDYGIYVFNSYHIIIFQNNIEMNINGVLLLDSLEIQIHNNVFTSNGIIITGFLLANWNTHIIENNSINGKIIYYYKNNYDGLVIPFDAGQVILANCSQFTAQDLTITDADRGIQLGFSKGNIVKGNTIQNNRIGIYLQESTHETIIENNLSSCGIVIEGIYKQDWNTHTIENNYVNEKPIYYYKNKTYGILVPSNAGQIIIANCKNVNIYNISFQNIDSGVQVGFSSQINIVENHFNNMSWAGISLWGSSNNNITKNGFVNNWGGIYFSNSFDNNIYRNVISKSHESGIEIVNSSNNSFLENIIENSSWDGVVIEYFSNNTTFSKNSILNCRESGLWLYKSNNGLFENNIITNNMIGVFFQNVSNNFIYKNIISNNIMGIFSNATSRNNLISKNTIENNILGIDLYDKSVNNMILNNLIQKNYYIGLNLCNCYNNIIMTNTITKNLNGVVLVNSSNNTIARNNISRNNQNGILFSPIIIAPYYIVGGGKSVNNTIENNLVVKNNRSGIHLYYYSYYNKIVSNVCNSNNIDGIGLNFLCSVNTVKNNICLNNMKGIAVRDSGNNLLQNNTCNNNEQGILLNNAPFTRITDNVCSDNKIGIYHYKSRRTVTSNNTCNDCSTAGITMIRSFANHISFNTIIRNWNGLWIEKSFLNLIRKNDIVRNAGIGIILMYTMGHRITSNNIHDSSKYDLAGVLCFDCARLNYWGGRVPLIFEKRLVFGWIRLRPPRYTPVDTSTGLLETDSWEIPQMRGYSALQSLFHGGEDVSSRKLLEMWVSILMNHKLRRIFMTSMNQ